MDCQEVKNTAFDYLQHNLSEERVTQIEEHLCICAQCRSYLSNILDNKVESPQNIIQSTEVSPKLKPNQKINSRQQTLLQYIVLGVAGLIVLFLIFLVLKSSF